MLHLEYNIQINHINIATHDTAITYGLTVTYSLAKLLNCLIFAVNSAVASSLPYSLSRRPLLYWSIVPLLWWEVIELRDTGWVINPCPLPPPPPPPPTAFLPSPSVSSMTCIEWLSCWDTCDDAWDSRRLPPILVIISDTCSLASFS